MRYKLVLCSVITLLVYNCLIVGVVYYGLGLDHYRNVQRYGVDPQARLSQADYDYLNRMLMYGGSYYDSTRDLRFIEGLTKAALDRLDHEGNTFLYNLLLDESLKSRTLACLKKSSENHVLLRREGFEEVLLSCALDPASRLDLEAIGLLELVEKTGGLGVKALSFYSDEELVEFPGLRAALASRLEKLEPESAPDLAEALRLLLDRFNDHARLKKP